MYCGACSPKVILGASLGVLLMAFTHNALAESSTDTIPETSVHLIGNYGFILDNREANCMLHSKVGDQEVSIALDMSSPCYWVRSEADEIIDYPYPDADITHTLLIAGTALDWDDQKKQYQKLPTDQYCTERLQGLVISNSAIQTSASSIEASNCIGQSLDEKVFYGIAHDEDIQPQLTLDEPPVEASLFDTIKQTFKGLFSSEPDAK